MKAAAETAASGPGRRAALPTGARRGTALWTGALWAGSAALALAAHAGAALWAARQEAEPFAAAAAPPAVMIDLAPVIAAPVREIREIAPDRADRIEVKSVDLTAPPRLEPPPAPAAPPPLRDDPAPRLDPPPEPDPVAGPPTLEPPPAAVPEALAPPPARPSETAPRPEPEPKPQLQLEKPRETRDKPAAPTPAEARAKADAPVPAETVRAPKTSSRQSGSDAPARWQARLMAHLERHQRYPFAARKRSEEGIALVRFQIDDKGNVRSLRLTRSSGFPDLDRAALDLVRRASPVPAPPPGVDRSINVPVNFDLP